MQPAASDNSLSAPVGNGAASGSKPLADMNPS
eukprot:SAG11_NODE_21356_length_427_cov_0.478659_1_plen_31_part_10